MDNFDDRYLGQKSSDPTVDNDGDALVSGALYFNTTDDIMKVYDGSLWVAAYASLSGAMFGANNLSDVADAAGSRANLGLGTAAVADSTDFEARLVAMAETKAVTAVDVFVYDTSKDSDGGAWRKRTQGTSWYNEALNTATRGSRREFPAVAVIVAEASKVTIYDGDDPSLPMWMVFNGVASGLLYPALLSIFAGGRGMSMLNGVLVGGRSFVSFIDDNLGGYWYTDGFYESTGNGLANRNVNYSHPLKNASLAVVNITVNDVAMTVLPDAPIDPATGLPVPTIAVATDGGVSVITDSGAVYDLTYLAGSTESELVEFDSNGGIYWGGYSPFSNASIYLYWNKTLPTADDATAPDALYASNENALLGDLVTKKGNFGYNSLSVSDIIAAGASNGLFLIDQKDDSPADGMTLQMTSSFNTGWMNGDIKGAFLSDTDDTDLVGGTLAPLLNGSFDADVNSWAARGSATLSWSAAETAALVNVTGSGGGLKSGLVAVTIGQTYYVRFEMWGPSIPAGNEMIFLANAGLPVVGFEIPTTRTEFGFFFTATGTLVRLELARNTAFTGDVYFDTFSIEEADADRSVNKKGLVVNGTVTRTPVATGADLVAYSGFSNSNYLEQPYNSDLDFGTGDFCVMLWHYHEGADLDDTIYFAAGKSSEYSWQVGAAGSDNSYLWVISGSINARSDANSVIEQAWTHLTYVRRNGVTEIWVNGVLIKTATDNTDLNSNQGVEIPLSTSCGDGNDLLSLLRISATAPSPEQIAKIYNDEKVLFQENAQATLYGSSDAVTALAHDDATGILSVGTSAGRSDFRGLRRVNNTTNAVGAAISASNGLIVEE